MLEPTKPSASSIGISRHVSELREMLDGAAALDDMPVARSPAMRAILRRASKYANSSATILLTGESGTGKEVLARWIHQQSPRTAAPYVRVNCAALPATLMESELFGHQRGAFTGAVQSRRGRLAAAEDGTLLLDEISEIALSFQAKLLRVLEEEEYQPVGCDENQRVRARVIATSNRSLSREVQGGRFRQDLFYRLNVLELELPPLRSRPEDIGPLVELFLQRFRDDGQVPIRGIHQDAMRFLESQSWPGNVRLLRNVIQRACVESETGELTKRDFEDLESRIEDSLPTSLETKTLKEIERYYVVAALRRHAGNKTAAARSLGVSARTLTNKLQLYRDLDRREAA